MNNAFSSEGNLHIFVRPKLIDKHGCRKEQKGSNRNCMVKQKFYNNVLGLIGPSRLLCRRLGKRLICSIVQHLLFLIMSFLIY